MGEGIQIQPWNQLDVHMLLLSVSVMAGLWLLLEAFPREARRLALSGTRPRNLTSRNASESPRTLGMMLNHAVALTGVWGGASVVFASHASQPAFWQLATWMSCAFLLKWLGSRLTFGQGDLASTLVEMARHQHTWVGVSLALWCTLASLNPYVRDSPLAAWGALVVFGITMLHWAFRSTQLIQGHTKSQLGGILYLCILEWGWALFWVLWSISASHRGH